ncbi:abc1 domain-containingprotein [Purpureocillium lavendulum]|uniref:Abc1 domain-containingprotein n=1 Tax=Purpureocillium lavendulum TaxID=1247861 RepID=A0AB34FR08_9HYPO|nr:abc1 domain-containingprotein [Purpureocillium lavendulum]
MPCMNRSPNGCWTCRIRHRKCDEAVPACRECADRTLPCHGYGRRPAWVDDETQLREELARIKRVVNSNFRRTRKRQQQKQQQQQRRSSSAASGAAPTQPSAAALTPLAGAGTSANHETSFREAQLLVHYLDYIFPLQYPYYRDDPALGGRGWLFWLLMKRGPLHQAVLTLAALHHYTEFAHSAEDNESEERESELLGYHTNALQRLRQAISEGEAEPFAENREQLIEFLACGSALISFEVDTCISDMTDSVLKRVQLFQGGVTNWQHHHSALVSVVNRLSPEAMARQGAHPDQPLLSGIDLAERFLVTKVVWLDVLAATVTGTAPRTRYAEWLRVEGVDMSRVMGCRNWAMRAIGDLASAAAESDSDAELDTRAIQDIRKRLEQGLDDLDDLDAVSDSSPPISDALTKVFASAALVQLQTTVPGTGASQATVHEAVSRVIAALRALPSWVSVRGLAWPVAVAGSVATAGEQQAFFEDLMRRRVLDGSGSGFTNCGTVLRVLKRCWEHEAEWPGETWTWRDGMADMGICALLI